MLGWRRVGRSGLGETLGWLVRPSGGDTLKRRSSSLGAQLGAHLPTTSISRTKVQNRFDWAAATRCAVTFLEAPPWELGGKVVELKVATFGSAIFVQPRYSLARCVSLASCSLAGAPGGFSSLVVAQELGSVAGMVYFTSGTQGCLALGWRWVRSPTPLLLSGEPPHVRWFDAFEPGERVGALFSMRVQEGASGARRPDGSLLVQDCNSAPGSASSCFVWPVSLVPSSGGLLF